jgi:hypothetical protein
MMLRQGSAKKHAQDRTSEYAREYNKTGCDGTHGRPAPASSGTMLPFFARHLKNNQAHRKSSMSFQ